MKSELLLMWEDTVGDLKAETFYIEEESKFLVRVTHLTSGKTKEEKFPALYQPLFGMDVADSNSSISIAEELARNLEDEKGI